MNTDTMTDEQMQMLRNTPAWAEACKQADKVRVERRRTKLAEIATLEAQAVNMSKRHDEEINRYFDLVRACELKVKQAMEKLTNARTARFNDVQVRRNKADRLRAELRSEPAPLIDSIVARIGAAAEAHRCELPDRRIGDDAETVAAAKRDWDAHRARREALQAARLEAEELRMQALDTEELTAQIKRIERKVLQ